MARPAAAKPLDDAYSAIDNAVVEVNEMRFQIGRMEARGLMSASEAKESARRADVINRKLDGLWEYLNEAVERKLS
jgi:hypothetical protein